MPGSIASGLVLGLALVLAVFDGVEEAKITGSALIALGVGFLLLAVVSRRFTDMPQQWPLAPAVMCCRPPPDRDPTERRGP